MLARLRCPPESRFDRHVAAVRQPQVDQDRVDERVRRGGAGRAAQPGGVPQGPAEREVGVDDVVLRDVADRSAGGGGAAEGDAVVGHLAARGGADASEQLEQGGLAGSARPHEGEQLAGADRERHVAQDLSSSGALADADRLDQAAGHAAGSRRAKRPVSAMRSSWRPGSSHPGGRGLETGWSG